MEGLLEWLQEFIKFPAVFKNFVWVDWLSLSFMVGGVLFGVKSGFIRELSLSLETMFVAFVSIEVGPKIASFFQLYVTQVPQEWTGFVGYLLILPTLTLIMIFFDAQLKKWFHSDIFKLLKVLGGSLFGAFHFLLVLSLVLQVMILIPNASMKRVFREGGSYSGHAVSQLAPLSHSFIKNPALFLERKVK